jgi:protocatechuate 3,4-dioxygenase beta subunit
MRCLFKIAIILIVVFVSVDCFAARQQIDLFSPKQQTPDSKIPDLLAKPKTFEKSNNLRKKIGSFELAEGEILYIEGIVTDAFGVPITNAFIKIWQTNSAGKYHTLLDKDSEYIDHNFAMSGEANTDNLGKYGFITIFPGFYSDRAPHIHMLVHHPKFGTVETQVYFSNHKRNTKDPNYLVYNENEREMITANIEYVNKNNPKLGKIATFNITLDGVHQYKGF